jgi:hypothetical protein
MIEPRLVNMDYVSQLWPKVAKWLESGAVYSCGEVTMDHIQMYMTQGQWSLFVFEKDGDLVGAAAVQFFNRPTGRVAFVAALGGEGVVNPECIEKLGQQCAQFGATQFEGAVRESVYRLFRQHGFKEKYRVVSFGIK